MGLRRVRHNGATNTHTLLYYISWVFFLSIKFCLCKSGCRANILGSWVQFDSWFWQLAIDDSVLSQLLAETQNWAHLFPVFQKMNSQGSEYFHIVKHSKSMWKPILGQWGRMNLLLLKGNIMLIADNFIVLLTPIGFMVWALWFS